MQPRGKGNFYDSIYIKVVFLLACHSMHTTNCKMWYTHSLVSQFVFLHSWSKQCCQWEVHWPHALIPSVNEWVSGLGLGPGWGYCVVFLDKTPTLTVPVSTQECKWVLANCWGNLTNCEGVACNGLASGPGDRNTPGRFMLQKLEQALAAVCQSAPRFHNFVGTQKYY